VKRKSKATESFSKKVKKIYRISEKPIKTGLLLEIIRSIIRFVVGFVIPLRLFG